jgi:hypothetical protein
MIGAEHPKQKSRELKQLISRSTRPEGEIFVGPTASDWDVDHRIGGAIICLIAKLTAFCLFLSLSKG